MKGGRSSWKGIVASGVAVMALASCSHAASSPEASRPSGGSPTGSLQPNYSLPVHCGVQYASFDGVAWEADPPTPRIPDVVEDPGGGGHNRYSVSGRMVRLSDAEAVFTTTEDPVGVVVHFHRWSGTPPGCA